METRVQCVNTSKQKDFLHFRRVLVVVIEQGESGVAEMIGLGSLHLTQTELADVEGRLVQVSPAQANH